QRPYSFSNLFELAVVRVIKQKRSFGISNPQRMLVHLRIDVPVSNKNILPAIVVEIKKLDPEGKKRNTDRPKIRGASHVSKLAVPIVVVEIVAVIGKIRFHDVWPAVVVIVGGIHTHSGLLFAIGAIGCSGLGAHLGESALTVVVVEQAGR